MWEVLAYFRWAEVEKSPIHTETFDTERKAKAAARIWMESGVEIVHVGGGFSFVPAGSIHYVQVREIVVP